MRTQCPIPSLPCQNQFQWSAMPIFPRPSLRKETAPRRSARSPRRRGHNATIASGKPWPCARSAIQLDPGYFEAQSNLGLAAYESDDLTQSLAAYETALAIKPSSFNARFNFALALKKAGYIEDAAGELERVLTVAADGESPTHLALVHLTLANLYADQFHQVAPARLHYLKVLELDPKNSQAVAIRYWLRDNP